MKLPGLFSALILLAHPALAELPRNTIPASSPDWPENFRLHLDGAGEVTLGENLSLTLGEATAPHDIAIEHPAEEAPLLRVWSQGKLVRGPDSLESISQDIARDFPNATLDFSADFTALATFQTRSGGTLFSMCAPDGKWSPAAKALFIRDGALVYDIGWLGAITAAPRVDDGKTHTVVLKSQNGTVELWLDGARVAEQADFTKPDDVSHIFKIGSAAPDFAGDFTDGTIEEVRAWNRALPEDEIRTLFEKDNTTANTPDFTHRPPAPQKPRLTKGTGWVQSLERSDHGEIVSNWNSQSLAEGATIYSSLCTVCHGDEKNPGSLPTATRFGITPMKNGADPYSMFLTLTHGYNQMVAQPQYTTSQKYAVIHYIRETFLKPGKTKELTELTEDYLASLPKGLSKADAEVEDRSLPPYERMDLGPALFWTYEVAPGNIAQKGLAIRLDEGTGGISKGRAWMVYDHDTMRLATATTGSFVDWKGIAFDGSHGTHTALTGDAHFINPDGPGWSTAGFEDTRPIAKDGKRYGPHPNLKFKGIYQFEDRIVISATIHGTRVLESPEWLDYGNTPVFVRTLNLSESKTALRLRIAPTTVNVVLEGAGSLIQEDGFWIASLPSNAISRIFISRADPESLASLSKSINSPLNLAPLTRGGPAKWAETTSTTSTTSTAGTDELPFATDDFPLPLENPWQSWLRPGGFDFTPDGKSAVVAMWNGDVWRVDGITAPAPAKLTWRRIASGLFQPLGVKFRGNELFITCRDQIVRLHDLNADGEIDFIECFNSDAEVTEHFHEFAMGLQIDAAGNLYYAKSGRHALDSVVPQHGTLLRVSADGARTDIIATGFRAANGVCINDDGTFFVTDQEGFWTPKNRINRVKPGGFYGNMFGYTSVTDTSDDAMDPPMVWITNEKDRSPAELVWIPKNAWGNLGGSLLNISYGTGKVFIVPHEEVNGTWQGAVCELPMSAFATGIMRGRFGADGSLYTCGMFAWAGNATSPGGFHRIRRTEAPAQVPLSVKASKGQLKVTFSTAPEITNASFKTWSLKRSANYGSAHHDERTVEIRATRISLEDPHTLILDIPELAPTDCYELILGEHSLHGTIHHLR